MGMHKLHQKWWRKVQKQRVGLYGPYWAHGTSSPRPWKPVPLSITQSINISLYHTHTHPCLSSLSYLHTVSLLLTANKCLSIRGDGKRTLSPGELRSSWKWATLASPSSMAHGLSVLLTFLWALQLLLLTQKQKGMHRPLLLSGPNLKLDLLLAPTLVLTFFFKKIKKTGN